MSTVDALPRRTLATGPLAVSELSLGCAQLGNLYRAVADEDARATVDAAWELGIRYFDTAPHYGLGLSERRLGAALAGRPRDELRALDQGGADARAARARRTGATTRASTCRPRIAGSGTSAATASCRSLEESLERLGLERVDIVYLHDPDDHWDDVAQEGYPALEELRDEGVVSSIGAGMNQSRDARRLRAPHRYRRPHARRPLHAARAGRARRSASCSASSVASRSSPPGSSTAACSRGRIPPSDAKYDYGDASRQLVDRAGRIADVCERHGVSLPAAAIAFPLAHPAVASVCLGARSPQQVERNVDLHRQPIPAGALARAERRGLCSATTHRFSPDGIRRAALRAQGRP